MAPQTTPRVADDATLWCGNAFEAFALTVDDVVDSHDALDDVGSVAGLVGRVDRATGAFADVDPEGSNVEGTEAPAPATPSGDVTELLDDLSDVWPVTDRRETDQTGDSAVPALGTDERTSVKRPSDGRRRRPPSTTCSDESSETSPHRTGPAKTTPPTGHTARTSMPRYIARTSMPRYTARTSMPRR